MLNELLKLIIAWTLLGALMATLLMLCLARLGNGQITPRKLVYLIFALVAIGGGCFLAGRLQFNPGVTGEKVRRPVMAELGQTQQQNAILQKDNLNLMTAYERATGRKIYVTKGRNFAERMARLNKQMKAGGRERLVAIYDAALGMQKRFGFAFLPAGADADAKAKFVVDRVNSLDATKRKDDFEPFDLWERVFADVSAKERSAAHPLEK